MSLKELPTDKQAVQGTGLGDNKAAGAGEEDANNQGDANNKDGKDGGGWDSGSSNNELGIKLQKIQNGVVGDSTGETYYGDIINF